MYGYISDYSGNECLRRDVLLSRRATRNRAAFRLNSINESECNGVERWNPQLHRMLAEWNDSDQARADRLREKAENRVKAAMAVAYGPEWEKVFALEFNGDPRGAPVNIHPANAERSHGIFCNSPIVAIW